MLGLLRKLTDTSSEIRREFGPRLHHHIPEAQRFSVGLFCAWKASVGAISGSRLRSVVLRALPFWAGFRPISSLFYLRSSGASPPGSLFGAGLRGGGWSWRLLEQLGAEIGRRGYGLVVSQPTVTHNADRILMHWQLHHAVQATGTHTLFPDCDFSFLKQHGTYLFDCVCWPGRSHRYPSWGLNHEPHPDNQSEDQQSIPTRTCAREGEERLANQIQ